MYLYCMNAFFFSGFHSCNKIIYRFPLAEGQRHSLWANADKCHPHLAEEGLSEPE